MTFEPDPCPESLEPIVIYVAVRRKQEGEQGREISDDQCGGGKPACKPSRLRDMVVVRSFPADKLPANLCRITDDHPASPQDLCACLKDCPCDCCGNSWVLLARLEYLEKECRVRCIDKSKRRYVKPIHCNCPAEEDACADLEQIYQEPRNIEAQFAHVADNYQRLNQTLGEQQTQLARMGDELHKMKEAWFEYQAQIAEDTLDEVQEGSGRKGASGKKKSAKKRSTRKSPGREGKK